MQLNRRNFMALLGVSPGAMLLKPNLDIPMGKAIQGKSADMVIIDEAPSVWTGPGVWVDPNPWHTKALKDAYDKQSMNEMLYEFYRLAPRSCCKIKI